jgi:flagellar basal body rod protein FlgG
VATLSLTTTADRQSLRKVGENLFVPNRDDLEMTPATGRIMPESLEGSNFEVTSGLAGMIEASRAYQMNATLLQMQDQVTGEAVSSVGRLT